MDECMDERRATTFFRGGFGMEGWADLTGLGGWLRLHEVRYPCPSVSSGVLLNVGGTSRVCVWPGP